MNLIYKSIKRRDAKILKSIFSIPEYDTYFAENDATLGSWKYRITKYYQKVSSFIVYDDATPIGWFMYSVINDECKVDILVLVPDKRYMGYGKRIHSNLLEKYPNLKNIRLDVQERNTISFNFYKNLGFVVEDTEMQPVGDSEQLFYKMIWNR